MHLLNNIVKLPYYYVPECPCCGSTKTGRFIKTNNFNPGWSEREALRNGELAFEIDEVPEANAICTDCGFSWPLIIGVSYLSMREINREKIKRGTEEKIRVYREGKEAPKKNPVSVLTKFVGRI